MDYYIDPTTRYPQETTRCPGMNPVMPILEEVFNPNGTQITAFENCVLISLDTEYDSYTHRISQIGLAGLDTLEIYKADNKELAKDLISSRLLLLEKQNVNKGAYLFNNLEKHYGETIESLLLPMFTITDPDIANPRNIVLVGHSIRSDIEEIKRSSGFDILALPMVKAVIDTSPLINRVFNTPERCHSLRQVCTLLGMYRRNIHTAGNDAMYTLKALLLMFYHYKKEKQRCDFGTEPTDQDALYTCQLEAIKEIGRCNNGRGRFAKQREKRKAIAATKPKNNKIHVQDILDCDVTEEAFIDGLFIT